MNESLENKIVQELPHGLIRWYDFLQGSSKLLVYTDEENKNVLAGALPDAVMCSVNELAMQNKVYDYIIGFCILDKSQNPDKLAEQLAANLSDAGRLLLFAENRLALKHFCGEKEYYANRMFYGLENYIRFPKKAQDNAGGREYAKAELKDFFESAGFKTSFYSVFPCLERPQVILADNYQSKEHLANRVFPQYRNPDTVFLREDMLYESLADNGLLHGMANGFFIECSKVHCVHTVKQVTVSSDRGHKNALATILKTNGTVVKKALYDEGKDIPKNLWLNNEYLRQRGLAMVPIELRNDGAVMPFMAQETALVYLQKCFFSDLPKMLEEMQKFWELIVKSSDHVDYEQVNWHQFEPGWEKLKVDDPVGDSWQQLANGTTEQREAIGPILARGYMDLVTLNCFYENGEFIFFDQESYMENIPAKAIFLRSIDCMYDKNPAMEFVFSRDDMLQHFNLKAHLPAWRKFINAYLEPLRLEKDLGVYHSGVRPNGCMMEANRKRMEYPAGLYERYMYNIFDDVFYKDIYLFGSGAYAKNLLAKYGGPLEIKGLLDNNSARWGEKVEGIPIVSPTILKDKLHNSKVIICIKDYKAVLQQLQDMGCFNISIYRPELMYSVPDMKRICAISRKKQSKKYSVGYVAGVFDMFHRGHLNLLQRAKEQCDYLIVGVVTDEQLMDYKKTKAIIPFEDRLAIVQGCRYVDEAVEIPANRPSTEYAHQQYNFDVQFSGSDYEDDPYWLAAREYLRKNGADLVFFPYTESVSSTKLKLQLKEANKTGKGDVAE